MFSFVRRHKILSFVVLANIIAVLAVILVIVIHNSKTAVVDVKVAPINATVELNGKKFDNFESYNVAPGEYHVRISMDGMQTKEYDIDLASDGFIRIWNYLLDDSGGFSYYETHPEDEVTLAEVADDEASQNFVEKYNSIFSIVDVLPLEYYDRSDPNNPIGVYIEQSDAECDKIVCLMVYGGEENRAIANELITEAGYEPNNYGIQFIGEG